MQEIWNEKKQPNPKAFLDLDNGVVYDVSTAPAHAVDIDLIWTLSSGGNIICSPSQYEAPSSGTSPNFQEGVLFAKWTQRNQTIIAYKSSQTVADFDAITNSSQMQVLIDQFNMPFSQYQILNCTSATFISVG